jgi:ribosome-associated toxin RatA of RatAB toxin-antitoxin module
VRARAEIRADPRTAWETITDYERLRDFVPDVEHSRIVTRDGNRLVVEHRGAFHLFFIEIPVRVRLAVQHEPFERVVARSQPGTVDGAAQTLREFSGTYVLTVVGHDRRAGVRLDYESRFELSEPLPPILGELFGTAMVQRGMRQQFEAMVLEIERRQAARPPIERSG